MRPLLDRPLKRAPAFAAAVHGMILVAAFVQPPARAGHPLADWSSPARPGWVSGCLNNRAPRPGRQPIQLFVPPPATALPDLLWMDEPVLLPEPPGLILIGAHRISSCGLTIALRKQRGPMDH